MVSKVLFTLFCIHNQCMNDITVKSVHGEQQSIKHYNSKHFLSASKTAFEVKLYQQVELDDVLY